MASSAHGFQHVLTRPAHKELAKSCRKDTKLFFYRSFF